jgi:hypothetical protein
MECTAELFYLGIGVILGERCESLPLPVIKSIGTL